MTDEKQLENIEDLLQFLKQANGRLADAQDELKAARREETSARNEVNDLQKRIDEALQGHRRSAPLGTDWNAAEADGI